MRQSGDAEPVAGFVSREGGGDVEGVDERPLDRGAVCVAASDCARFMVRVLSFGVAWGRVGPSCIGGGDQHCDRVGR